jgi:hypothetical protein
MLLTMVLAVACGQAVQPFTNKDLGLTAAEARPGMRVLTVERGKPGWSTGLQPGDVVTHLAVDVDGDRRKPLVHVPVTPKNFGRLIPPISTTNTTLYLVVYRPSLRRTATLPVYFAGDPQPFPKPSTEPKP